MMQVLNALKHLHKAKIIHRDLKPDNILLRSSDVYKDEKQVVLIDFGLSTFNHSKYELYPRCGTPGFAAPEIANYVENGEDYDERIDLYSFGVTLYYIMTGRLPYPLKRRISEESREVCIDLNKSDLFSLFSHEGSVLSQLFH